VCVCVFTTFQGEMCDLEEMWLCQKVSMSVRRIVVVVRLYAFVT
jgi:hypothetical protein